jgi:cytochrome c oxidase subunit 1
MGPLLRSFATDAHDCIMVPILSGEASVLYTFYPPLLGGIWYYLGTFLLVGGSIDLGRVDGRQHVDLETGQSRQARPARDVRDYLDGAALGLGRERRRGGIDWNRPATGVAFGFTTEMDAGLARMLFSVTLHAIVYFWLMPAYIAFYTQRPPSTCR